VDKGYDTEDFVNELKSMNVALRVAAKAKGSAIDGRTTRHAGIRQRIRKRIEEAFGWSKTIGPAAKTMLRGARWRSVHADARRLQSGPAIQVARAIAKTAIKRTDCGPEHAIETSAQKYYSILIAFSAACSHVRCQEFGR
jgi:hypothetical protein